MSATELKNAGGFTPVLDSIIQRYGVYTALVFGKTWRYCQMRNGVCEALHERLVQELGIGVRTVIRHLQLLVRDGYLENWTQVGPR